MSDLRRQFEEAARVLSDREIISGILHCLLTFDPRPEFEMMRETLLEEHLRRWEERIGGHRDARIRLDLREGRELEGEDK